MNHSPGHTSQSDHPPNGQIRELTREQGLAFLDREARRYLQMSAEEFIRAHMRSRLATVQPYSSVMDGLPSRSFSITASSSMKALVVLGRFTQWPTTSRLSISTEGLGP